MLIRPKGTLRFYCGFLPLACLIHTATAAPGGFTEQPDTAIARPVLSPSTIQNLVPSRGKFTFPAPYNTEAVRLTNADDCNGLDCVNYIGYSYWNNINNHVGSDTMLVFVGLSRDLGGAGPTLLQYNKLDDSVQNLGPLFDSSHQLSWATGEGWYFSASMPTTMYINREASLQRYDVMTKQFTTVFDVTAKLGAGHYIWQAHSSADDRVHSATLRASSNYAMLGCVVYNEDSGALNYYKANGEFDECQVDKSGDWLLIKENVDGQDGEDNRIINLVTGQERILLDRDGAAGHSDMGHGYMIAADNYADNANTQKVWDFNASQLTGNIVYHNNNWDNEAPAHVSHGNARPDLPASQQYACGSSANSGNSAEANEIICFGLDGDNEAVVVAPVMTDPDASGGGDSYANAPKGNLDVTGKYFIWSSNMSGPRLDVFIVKVPDHLLTDGSVPPLPEPDPVPPPVVDPVDPVDPVIPPVIVDPVDPVDPLDPVLPPAGAMELVWQDVVRAVATGNTLTKTSGCNGCADAGGVSRQILKSGDGWMEFTVDGVQTLHYAGLSVQQAGTAAGKIDFALAVSGSYAEVRENGAYKADTMIVSGDVLRIAVASGKVSYAKNGKVFYQSSAAPVYPLRAYSTLLGKDSRISNAFVAGGSATTAPAPAPAPAPIPSGQLTDMVWAYSVNAVALGGTLTKLGGCDGCADAGAVSQQAIQSGDNGHVEFTVTGSTGLIYNGLSVQKAGTAALAIDYALSLQGQYAEVRENGVYRADVPVGDGDVLRIAVQSGKVTYAKNGTVFHTSAVAPTFPLRNYATLLSSGSSVNNARMLTGS